jgi:hypothetical protein
MSYLENAGIMRVVSNHVQDSARLQRIMAKGDDSAARDARVRGLPWSSVIVTLGLHVILFGGFVMYPLMLFATLVHELGHGTGWPVR